MLKVCSALVAASTLSGCLAPALLLTGATTYGAERGGNAMVKKSYTSMGRKMSTAEAIGNDVRFDAIKISNVTRTAEGENWTADTPIGVYSCTQLAGRAHATCVKAGGAEAVGGRKR